MVKYVSGSMPRMVTELVPGPRTASAGPVTVGATATTPGVRLRSASTCFHPTIERMRCGGRWVSTDRTVPSSPTLSGRGSTRGISSGGRTTTCAWLPSVRSTMLCCRPVMRADRKMMTPTPTPIPVRMSHVCRRPSRR